MNLPAFIETLPVHNIFKILCTILILSVSLLVLYFLIIVYRKFLTKSQQNGKPDRFSFYVTSFFTDSLFISEKGRSSTILKLQLPITLLFLLYLLYFPLVSIHTFSFFALYSASVIFLFFMLFLSQQESVFHYFFIKHLQMLLEYFFLILFLILILSTIDAITFETSFFTVIAEIVRVLLVLILFISLWIFRHTLSLDMYCIYQPWSATLSDTGKKYLCVIDQTTGIFLLGLFLNISIRRPSPVMTFLNEINNSFLLLLIAIVVILFLDLFQRRVMSCYSWPNGSYLRKLNNFIFLPFLVIVSIGIVLL